MFRPAAGPRHKLQRRTLYLGGLNQRIYSQSINADPAASAPGFVLRLLPSPPPQAMEIRCVQVITRDMPPISGPDKYIARAECMSRVCEAVVGRTGRMGWLQGRSIFARKHPGHKASFRCL